MIITATLIVLALVGSSVGTILFLRANKRKADIINDAVSALVQATPPCSPGCGCKCSGCPAPSGTVAKV
jgi:hypothetical protein